MRRLLAILSGLLIGFMAQPAMAQTLESIAQTIDATGYYIDPGVEANLSADDWEGIAVANDNNIAFASFDQNADGDANGQTIAQELVDQSNNYDAIVVLFVDGVYSAGSAKLNQATSRTATIDLFRAGEVGAGLISIVDFVGGDISAAADAPAGDTSTNDGAVATPVNTSSPTEDSSGGFPWVWIILASIATFFFVRWRSGKKKAAKLRAADMETDRAEIKEQLKDNADQVISLGDSVIASGDQELIDLYDKASRTYQEVSQSVDDAATPEAVDALDDRIDEAEWELDVIQARLDGTKVPPKPTIGDVGPVTPPAPQKSEDDRNQPPPPTADKPALGPNESVLGGSGPRRSSQRSRYEQPSRSSRQSGSGMGQSLLMMLAGFLMSSYGQSSRRTQRRTSSNGSSQPPGGSLGGSVLGGAPPRS